MFRVVREMYFIMFKKLLFNLRWKEVFKVSLKKLIESAMTGKTNDIFFGFLMGDGIFMIIPWVKKNHHIFSGIVHV